ncbi:MAG: TolC family protein [Elusimicrobia bacterium]|nr:TolC family protein [Elusimicrobiota bacterium]
MFQSRAGILYIIVTFIIVVRSSLFAAESPTVTLSEVIKVALRENPQLKAAQAKYKASQATIKSAGSLPDPWLGLEYQNIPQGTLKFNEAEMKMYTFSQEIPWPGKLSLKTKVAASSADITAAEYEGKQREIIALVKRAYFELYQNYQLLKIAQENEQLLRQTVSVAQQKYSAGKNNLAEVLKAKVELAKLQNNIISLKNQLAVSRTRLNTLLNRKPEAEIGRPEYTDNNEFRYTLTELTELALAHRPELNIARANVKQSAIKLSLAKRDYLPDFMLAYKQRVRSGEFMGWDSMLNVMVPLWFWQNQNNMVKSMRAEKEMSEADYQAMARMVVSEIEQMYWKAEAAQRQLKLYETDILPQAEQVWKISQTGYETDKADFLDLLDSQRMYLEAVQDYYMSLTDYQMAKAELEQMVGEDLP